MASGVVYYGMLKMELDREEIEFVSEQMLKYDAIEGFTVNDIEVRVHGTYLNDEGKRSAVGSSATYRTSNDKEIYSYHHQKAREAMDSLKKVLDKRS